MPQARIQCVENHRHLASSGLLMLLNWYEKMARKENLFGTQDEQEKMEYKEMASRNIRYVLNK